MVERRVLQGTPIFNLGDSAMCFQRTKPAKQCQSRPQFLDVQDFFVIKFRLHANKCFASTSTTHATSTMHGDAVNMHVAVRM